MTPPERPGMASPPEEGILPGHPERIGPYRLLQVLGQGGMGLVYVAEQTTPVRRRVALKVIRAGMDSREVVARFEAERQALAVMEHPNIAKVLDGGATDEGRPYFVMELVKGVPLTDYCDTSKLSTRDRLALFLQICSAVQHAHQKGVIHRDLKPSNILVMIQDGQAVPKVIDFGIAKALAQPLTEKTLVTDFGRPMGTPAYMSPEQAEMSGLDVDTRTDVYSLGVILYELLVGRLPMDPMEVGMPVFMARLAQRETNPSMPSARLGTLGSAAKLVTSARRTDMKELRKELRGDLDWIIMKAMDPDRTRRYETANGLAMDIGRYLASEPIVARPPSTMYRLARFTRRNRAAVIASGLVVAALVIGVTVASIGMVRATRAEAVARLEAETARQVASFLTGLFEVSDPGEARGNTITARELLDRGADRIRTELAAEPLVQARMMFTIGSVYRKLGLFGQSQPLLEQAVAISESRLPPDAPQVEEGIIELARLAQQQGRFAQAESLYRRSLATRERTLGPDHPDVALPLSGLGGMFVTRGRYAEAESLLGRAVELRSANGAPEDTDFARMLRNLASAYLADGKYAEAEPVFQRSLAVYERLVGGDHPDVGRVVSNLGIVYYQLGRYDEAERYYVRAETILEKTLGPDHPNVATINLNLGEIAWRRGRLPEAETRFLRALAIWQKRLDPGHPSLATAEYDLANVLRDQGRFGEAEPRYRRALQIREAAFGTSSPALAEVLRDYGRLLRRTGRAAEAGRLESRAAAIDSTVVTSGGN